MGCDGGTVPKKRKLIVKKKNLQKFSQPKTISSSIYWEMCRYTKQPLRTPVVSDKFGFLYNKKSILLALFEKEFKKNKSLQKDFGHIKSLKDIQDVNFSTRSDNDKTWICSLTGKEIRGPFHFVLFIPCGHVVSKQGYEKVCSSTKKCCCCNKTIENIIILNNDDNVIEKMREKDEKERKELKKRKKERKKKKNGKRKDKKIGKKRKRSDVEKGKVNNNEKIVEQPLLKKVKFDIPERIKDQMFVNEENENEKLSSDSAKFMNRSFF